MYRKEMETTNRTIELRNRLIHLIETKLPDDIIQHIKTFTPELINYNTEHAQIMKQHFKHAILIQNIKSSGIETEETDVCVTRYIKNNYCEEDKFGLNPNFYCAFCCCGNYIKSHVAPNNIRCEKKDCLKNWKLRACYSDGYYKDYQYYFLELAGYDSYEDFDDENYFENYLKEHGVKSKQQLFQKTNKEIVKCKLKM
jgi:hypothetical protein